MTQLEQNQLKKLILRNEFPNLIRLKNGQIAQLIKIRIVKNIPQINYAIYRRNNENIIISIKNLEIIEKVISWGDVKIIKK